MKTFRLNDGRTLTYHEYGDTRGKPLINCHGGLVSGQDIMFADTAAKRAGVRIISPDRPGIGGSSFQPNRTLLNWPDDIEALANQLNIKKFAVLGWSMGGPYALAVAYALPQRVSQLTLVASCLELEKRKNFSQLNPMDKRFSKRSHSLPLLAETIYWTMGRVAQLAPKFFVKSSVRQLSQSDALIITSEPLQNFVIPARQALDHPKGLVEEYRVFIKPFGFKMSDIKVKTDIWQGSDDSLVPPAWAKEIHNNMAGSSLHMVHDAGHFLAHTKIEEILNKI